MNNLRPQEAGSTTTIPYEESIRHRISLSPRIPQNFTFSSSYLSHPRKASASHRCHAEPTTPILQVEDVDDYSQPTVLLVKGQSPTSLLATSQSQKLPFQSMDFSETLALAETLSSAPLTPYLDVQQRSDSHSSEATRLSEIPRLPTPDFSSAHTIRFDSLHDVMHSASKQGLLRSSSKSTVRSSVSEYSIVDGASIRTVMSHTRSGANDRSSISSPLIERISRIKNRLKNSPVASYVLGIDEQRRASHQRPDSSASSRGSVTSSARFSDGSSDSGRATLLAAVDTTDKFTHKWPRPKAIKNMSSHRSAMATEDKLNLSPDILAAESDADIGLGMERVGRWNKFKWCLLLSVTTIFTYSVALLVYSILTWYQSKLHCSSDDAN